ncbi:phosphotransferase [Liquorilactobacillus sicerae]|uniref:phosphotransferase n=1 Tax=Liquorilactobacillus sicerae TaxID=1416943 RepID=UPI00247FACBD|nr:phosphotransferase [Liquorilactobacillus sicerae]
MLIDFLNDYYQADLKSIHDVAGNQHLVGESRLYHAKLFVKIFKEKEMFYAEQHVNEVYAPNVYLDNVIFEDNYVVTLRDRQMQELEDRQINGQVAYQFGKLLGEFHNLVTGKVLVYEDQRPLPLQIKEKAERLKDSAYAAPILTSLKLLQADFSRADEEYEQLPKVVLHGDFSVRNIMEYQGKLVLIDFERSKIGVTYQDFIKFFYNEVKDPRFRQRFLDGYEAKHQFEIPSHELQRCLLLLSALEICEYNTTHPGKKYGTMAQQMLATIKNGDAVLSL